MPAQLKEDPPRFNSLIWKNLPISNPPSYIVNPFEPLMQFEHSFFYFEYTKKV